MFVAQAREGQEAPELWLSGGQPLNLSCWWEVGVLQVEVEVLQVEDEVVQVGSRWCRWG